ncbi:MAG: acyclic terpene utilization AtuA family protein [Chloroflexi bacterium]|nr:acyclic terpene utilization AtuA family protein [Chloroflexota bacterium]
MTTLSATGALGHEPIHRESFLEGIKRPLDFLGADAGSGDSGPFFLGANQPMNPREWEEHDLELLLCAARERRIPLVIGSAGGAGTTRGVDDYVEIIRELAAKHRLEPFRLARIESEVPIDYLRERMRRETIEPLGATGPLTSDLLDQTSRVVAMMGVEPYFKAFDLGADVVIAGRSCDDAIYAALPLRAGFPKGLSFHLGKTLECASLVGTPSMAKETIYGRITDEYVELEPMHPAQRCTPESVAGHSLYERAHPYRQAYPGGILDTGNTVYEQVSERATRFWGSQFVGDPEYRLKLEGAGLVGYRALTIGAVRDPIAIESLDWVLDAVRQRTREQYGQLEEGPGRDYQIVFHQYGKNGVMGALEPVKQSLAHEICIVTEVVARTQEIADLVARFTLYRLLFPTFVGQKATAGGIAMLRDEVLQGQPSYRWTVDHLLPVSDPLALFPITLEEVGV